MPAGSLLTDCEDRLKRASRVSGFPGQEAVSQCHSEMDVYVSLYFTNSSTLCNSELEGVTYGFML
jgi:hypothetical protein